MSYLKKRLGFLTDTGKRDKNEDAVICIENKKEDNDIDIVIGIADGMGGYSGGEIASNFIIQEIERLFKKNEYKSFAAEIETDGRNYPYIFKMAIEEINRRLFEQRQGNSRVMDMGSTFTGAIGHETDLFLAHIGDSRAYQIRGGKIKALTEDHTIETKISKALKNKKHKSPEENPEYYGFLYRSMGYKPWIKMDFQTIKIEPHDIYIFCSDGFHKFVDEKTLLSTILNLDCDPDKSCEKLINLAKQNGSNDNISIAILYYVDFMGLEMDRNKTTLRMDF